LIEHTFPFVPLERVTMATRLRRFQTKVFWKLLITCVLALVLPPGTWGSSQRTIRLAICQILVIDSDRTGNFRRIEYALDQAESQHADIALFPESSILGWENPEARNLALPIPGGDSDRIAELARKHQIMIAIGLDEKDGSRLYDSAILVDSSGKILWKHRKINVLPGLMSPPYDPGRLENIGVAETPFGRIGVLICADTFTDSHLERLRPLKPDLLLVPYGWAAKKGDWPEHSKELEELVTRRAAALGIPMAGADLVGEMTHGAWRGYTYGGASVVSDGKGAIVLRLRDRDTDLQVINLSVGSENNAAAY
jgi:predicted amidohydrolase